ncbi:NF-kappa-B inhibitor delta isoform X2 [Heterodontus francisci]|uniref:NF-kappa-B inhibitor delta isoform X2 n=1 Tax=Heterodontus francisci TaxID=7792 RepID=UPI00355B9D93
MSTLSASERFERDYNMSQKMHWQKCAWGVHMRIGSNKLTWVSPVNFPPILIKAKYCRCWKSEIKTRNAGNTQQVWQHLWRQKQSTASSDQSQQRPYLGVRVKDPVKELLKRKRKNIENTNTNTTSTMVLPHLSMTCYSQIGHPMFPEADVSSPSLQHAEEGTFHTTWLPQSSSATLQPIPQWSPCPDYNSHEAVNSSYMQDMCMQPVCSSYAVVGPPSVVSYAPQPLLSNFGVNCQSRTPTPAGIPQLELADQQPALSYFSWSQTLSTLPTQVTPCQTNSLQSLPPQFVPLPISVPEPGLMELEDARRTIASMAIEKLLQQDEDNDTILHIYAAKGMREHAYAAAERMRELRRLDTKEHRGKTPLLVAVVANQPLIVRDLIMFGADLNAVDDKGQTFLHLAATYGHLSIIQMVLAAGALVNLESRDFEGLTPLHCAVISHNSVFRELCFDHTLLPQRQDELQYKAEQLQSCIRLLIEMGALITSQDVKSNKTVVHLTVQEGNLLLLDYFLKLSGARSHEFVNMKAHGNTALHMAAGLQNERNQERIIKLLLYHGADPSIRNLENDQPIHLVQPGEQGDRIRHLLKKGRVGSGSNQRSATS